MKNEPTNHPWPYDTRPVADQGRDEAKLDGQGFLREEPKRDSPLTEYEKLLAYVYESARTDDDRATGVLAEFFEDGDFWDLAHQVREGLRDAFTRQRRGNTNTELQCVYCGAHESQRHNAGCPIVSPRNVGVDLAKECDRTAYYQWPRQSGKSEAAQAYKALHEQVWTQENPDTERPDSTTQLPFTEEEIAAVKRMRIKQYSFAAMAELCRNGQLAHAFYWMESAEGQDYWSEAHGCACMADPLAFSTNITDEARAKLNRYAAIARHLAEGE